MANTRQNLATLLATSRAVNLAENLAASAGGVTPDFRLAVAGAQWSFRRAAAGEGDGGAADNNLILGSGACQTMVDILPQASKAVSETEYIVDAISASQRPTLGSSGELVFASASNQGLVKDPSPLVVSMASRNLMSLYFVWGPDGQTQCVFTASQAAAAYWDASALNASGADLRARRSGAGPTGARAASAGVVSVDAVVFNGTNASIYSDGAFVTSAALGAVPTTPTRLALGFQSRNAAEFLNYFNGKYAESFGAFAEHDATTVASVSAQLKSYWQSRGLTIP